MALKHRKRRSNIFLIDVLKETKHKEKKKESKDII